MANELLEKAIEKHKIPPWPYEASYDRIIVFSLPEEKGTRETYVPGGKILMTEERQAATKNETPRAVIVSAGLGALDVLRSHGLGLGSVVWVARLSPWRHQVDRTVDGKDIEFMFLRVGDVVGSETLLDYRKKGLVDIVMDAEGHHRYVFDGTVQPRFDPPSYAGG